MKFEEIHCKVGHVPFISASNARWLYRHILEHRVERILELGIAHGTATCYMAAALQEAGGGRITSVDLASASETYVPSAEAQLKATGLESFVQIHRMESGYTWFLHDAIEENTVDGQCQPIFDLCIIDGPKNWTIDGAAFFMADKLLKAGGWMIFDDYGWSYAAADAVREATDGITHRTLSPREMQTPHVREIFELLVKQHPSYSEFMVIQDGDWAVAHKVQAETRRQVVIYHDPKPLQTRVLAYLRKWRRSRPPVEVR